METLRIGPGVPRPAARRGSSALARLGRGLLAVAIIVVCLVLGTMISGVLFVNAP